MISTFMMIEDSQLENFLEGYSSHSELLKKISFYIDKYDKFILTTHVSSDADGISSEIALAYLLKQFGKEVIIINHEKPDENIAFIDYDNLIHVYEDYKDELSKIDISEYFLFIIDNSEVKRIGDVSELLEKKICAWATIDHHKIDKQENFCVDSNYIATAEIIWDVFHYYKVKFTKDIAVALYTGLSADSGNFRYSKTSIRTHLAAGEFLQFDIDSDYIYRKLFESHEFDRLYLLKSLMSDLYINKELKFAIGFITLAKKKNLELGESPSDGLANILLSVKDIKMAAIFTETEEGYLKSSMRSIGKTDVSEIAKHFGGGGHKNAAGLKVEIPFEEAKEKIIEYIESYLG